MRKSPTASLTGLGVILSLVGLLGIGFKCFRRGRSGALSTASYIVMGWIAVAALRPLLEALSWRGLL